MASHEVPPTVRWYRAVPWLRVALVVAGIAIFVEFADGIAGGLAFENDPLSKWNSRLAKPLTTAALVASPGWWFALYWLRARSARPVYAAAALVIVTGCLGAGYLDHQLRADQKSELTSALTSLHLGSAFTPGPVVYRPRSVIDLPAATRQWTVTGDVVTECHDAARSIAAWTGKIPNVFTTESSHSPYPICTIGAFYRGRPVYFDSETNVSPGTWTLKATITPT